MCLLMFAMVAVVGRMKHAAVLKPAFFKGSIVQGDPRMCSGV